MDLLTPDLTREAPPSFTIYTGALAVEEGADGRRIIRGTASSTITDLAGDRMSAKALESMRRSAMERMTIFTNHTYDVPDNLFGTVLGAAVVTRETFADLDLTIEVVGADVNPKAEQTYRAIQQGMKLGLSIGAQVVDWHIVTVTDAKGRKRELVEFDDVLLLETSVVGIPCNPRSWVQNALKSLRASSQPVVNVHLDGNAIAAHVATVLESPVEDDLTKDATEVVDATPVVPPAAEADADPAAVVDAPPVAPAITQSFQDVLKGLVAAEVAESQFQDKMWRLTYALQSVIYDQMRAGDLSQMGANLSAACAEFVTLALAEIATARSAGLDTSDPDGLDDCYYAILPDLAKSMGDADATRLRSAHDHMATALNLACAAAPDDTPAVADEAAAELDVTADAGAALVEELTTNLATLEAQKTALEVEVTAMTERREAILKQGTGRPTQQPAAPTELDIVRASNEDIAARALTRADEFADLITR